MCGGRLPRTTREVSLIAGGILVAFVHSCCLGAMTFGLPNTSVAAPGHTIQRASLQNLKETYEESLFQLCDIFPDWSEDDLVTILSDLGAKSLGHFSQWVETGRRALKKDSALQTTARLSTSRNENHRSPNHQEPQSHLKPRGLANHERPTKHVRPTTNKTARNKDTTTLKAIPSEDKQTTTTPKVLPKEKPSSLNAKENIINDGNQKSPQTGNNVLRYKSIKSNPIVHSKAPIELVDSEKATTDLPNVESDQLTCIDYLEGGDSIVKSHEDTMSQLVSSIIEEEIFQPVPPRPILEMPKTLSSRISAAVVQQPVVVLPLTATVKQDLSVNFGVNHLHNQLQVQRAFDSSPVSKQMSPHVMSPPRYTSTSVEATIISSPRMEQSSADAAAIRRNQPIQRPIQPHQRDPYTTPPPGLSSEIAPGSDMQAMHAISYPKSQMPQSRYNSFPNGPHIPIEDNMGGDAAPGFPQYYNQTSRSPYSQHTAGVSAISSNPNYSRSMEISKPPTIEQSRQAQSFVAPWSSYSNPQSQHGNYYPNSHYSQHVYPETGSYHSQQQPYPISSNGRYQHQNNLSYSSQNAYANNNFYVSGPEHNYTAGRASNPQVPRQVFQGSFPQSKNI